MRKKNSEKKYSWKYDSEKRVATYGPSSYEAFVFSENTDTFTGGMDASTFTMTVNASK